LTDPFARARAMHLMRQGAGPTPGGNTGVQAQAMPASPAGPTPSASAVSAPTADYHSLAKKFGIAKLKLDSNPVVARTQLLAHLQQKLGPNFMKHPGVSDLLAAYNNGSTLSHTDANAMSSQAKRTAQTLMGG
jgi:hypothetical protein